jgi:hypothetical protein
MFIIGCDLRTRFQRIAMLDTQTGELKDKFPQIWTASPIERDVRQLLRHRHKLVCWRTSVRNQLHALAMGEGICRKGELSAPSDYRRDYWESGSHPDGGRMNIQQEFGRDWVFGAWAAEEEESRSQKFWR